MSFRNLSPFYQFWQKAFDLSNEIESAQGIIFSCGGRYIQRGSDKVYLYKTDFLTILAIHPDKISDVIGTQKIENLVSDLKLIEQILEPLEKCFDDIDHDITPEVVAGWELPVNCTRPLSISDAHLVEDMYLDCSGEDRETTAPNIEKDLVWGLFHDEKLIALSSCYRIPETDIADLTVVTRKSYRGQGCAKKVLKPLIQSIFQSGLIPRYRAYRQNLATIKVAESLGFVRHATIQAYSLEDS